MSKKEKFIIFISVLFVIGIIYYSNYLGVSKKNESDTPKNVGVNDAANQSEEKGPKKTLEWDKKAAAKGNPGAQYNMGRGYLEGKGVEQNKKKAVELFKKAAAQGYAPAQYNLGIMFKFGQGTEKDPQLADQWIQKARDNGYQPAN